MKWQELRKIKPQVRPSNTLTHPISSLISRGYGTHSISVCVCVIIVCICVYSAYHIGLLKAKLAKLKREILAPSSKGGKPGEGFDVTKSGDARVGMIGFPSVGSQ
jgi:hypothetical protein